MHIIIITITIIITSCKYPSSGRKNQILLVLARLCQEIH